jgi:hypothetical protein
MDVKTDFINGGSTSVAAKKEICFGSWGQRSVKGDDAEDEFDKFKQRGAQHSKQWDKLLTPHGHDKSEHHEWLFCRCIQCDKCRQPCEKTDGQHSRPNGPADDEHRDEERAMATIRYQAENSNQRHFFPPKSRLKARSKVRDRLG